MHQNEILTGPSLVNFINEAFANVANDIAPNSWWLWAIDDIPDSFFIPVDSVQSAYSNNTVHQSIAPDNIPNWLLKKHCYYLSHPICYIFNVSIREGFVSTLWEYADVIPNPQESVIRSACS
jgi:hypothetical protein